MAATVKAAIVLPDGRTFTGTLVEHKGRGVIVIEYKGERVAGVSADLPNALQRAGVRA